MKFNQNHQKSTHIQLFLAILKADLNALKSSCSAGFPAPKIADPKTRGEKFFNLLVAKRVKKKFAAPRQLFFGRKTRRVKFFSGDPLFWARENQLNMMI